MFYLDHELDYETLALTRVTTFVAHFQVLHKAKKRVENVGYDNMFLRPLPVHDRLFRCLGASPYGN